MVVEGLQQQSNDKPKKIIYGNRKKKGPAAATDSTPTTRDPSPVRESTPPAPEPPSSPTEPVPTPEGVKDDWDASSDDEPVKTGGVKDAWDDSSDEEEEIYFRWELRY